MTTKLDLEYEEEYKKLVSEVGEPLTLTEEEYDKRKAELFENAKARLLADNAPVKRKVINDLGKQLFRIGTKPLEYIPKVIIKDLVHDGKPMAHPDYIRRSFPEAWKDYSKVGGKEKFEEINKKRLATLAKNKELEIKKKSTESQSQSSTTRVSQYGLPQKDPKNESTQKTNSTSTQEPSVNTKETGIGIPVKRKRQTKRQAGQGQAKQENETIGTQVEEIVFDIPIPELESKPPSIDLVTYQKLQNDMQEQIGAKDVEIARLKSDVSKATELYDKLFQQYEQVNRDTEYHKKTVEEFKVGFAKIARPFLIRKWVDWKNKAGNLIAILGFSIQVNPAKRTVGQLSDVMAFSTREEVDRDKEHWAHQTQGKYYLEL
jgi:hypothetical protein